MKKKISFSSHLDSSAPIIQVFQSVSDPRSSDAVNFSYPLPTILFITIVCSLCGSDDWETIVIQANAMKDWLGKFVDLPKGIPCVRTFTRLFSAMNPKELNRVLLIVADRLGCKEEGEVISFDGKTLRGTAVPDKGLKAIHTLNAWSHERGLCLGHIKVEDKSNEIVALPELMDLLDLKGTIITADAMHTQKSTAAKAIDMGADYVLPVKKNQPNMREEVDLLFSEVEAKGYKGVDGDEYETVEKNRGRVEVRTYTVVDAEELPISAIWKGLKTVGKVVRSRTYQGKTGTETLYYISSCEIDAKQFAKVVRGHWGIENSLHLVLDITFREDHLRYRDRVGAGNLATIRKLTLSTLAKDKTFKCGKAGKRIAAATDPKYREKLLKLIL